MASILRISFLLKSAFSCMRTLPVSTRNCNLYKQNLDKLSSTYTRTLATNENEQKPVESRQNQTNTAPNERNHTQGHVCISHDMRFQLQHSWLHCLRSPDQCKTRTAALWKNGPTPSEEFRFFSLHHTHSFVFSPPMICSCKRKRERHLCWNKGSWTLSISLEVEQV